MESKFNPLIALGRTGSLGLSTLVNKFNADAELLDDLVLNNDFICSIVHLIPLQNDHWTAKGHKVCRTVLSQPFFADSTGQKERNMFIEQMQAYAKAKRIRITFLSGDVHCAAVGAFKTLAKGKNSGMAPAHDHRYMLNIVASAIVNKP